MRYKMTIAYDGSEFHGWQKQEPPDAAPLRTVQGVMEQTLTQVLRQPIQVVGASRTDAGVHALGQVAHFDATVAMPLERVAGAVTSRLPEDVEVLTVETAAPTFDAISDCVSKQYRYRIHNSARRPLGIRHLVYHCWCDLDLERMRDAASRLRGEHDFEGFSAAGHGRESTVRTLHRCDIERHDEQVHVVVAGNGFLYHMVRIIVGTLVEVGRGRFEPHCVEQILAEGDRGRAGPTLVPNGLCLEHVRYDRDDVP